MQLTIDTSSQKIGIALSNTDKIVQEYMWHSQENHTRELMPGIMGLLECHNVTIHAIDCIFVAKGPGSFNGLRVGMSTAKGLALALNIPLIGISTLAAEAYLHAGSDLPLCPLHEAGHGEVAAALFQMVKEEWQQLQEEHITTIDQLPSVIGNNVTFCGEITTALAAEIKNVFGEQANIFPLPDNICRASLIAQLGLKRLAEKDFDNASTIQPLYLRRPPITRPKADKRIIMQDSVTDEY